MDGKQRIIALFTQGKADRVGFWLGNPTEETKAIYCNDLGLEYVPPPPTEIRKRDKTVTAAIKKGMADVNLGASLDSDLFWCSPELDGSSWQHPEGKPIFDCYGGKPKRFLGQPGIFAECEDVEEVLAYGWPDPGYMDFTSTLEVMEYARSKGMAIAGGMWIPFFHVLCDFFGMENYFIKMYTHPEVVEAATDKVLAFYLETNRRFLDLAASRLDAFFFGNDLGSQQDLLVSPEALRRFVFPGIRRVVHQVKAYGLKIMLHSCGAVSKIIPNLIEIGIHALHPLQARAKGMGAQNLARSFKGDLVFVGGVDTQDLLPFRSPKEVRKEVGRLKDLFGHGFIVSPSHEALLPNVRLENVLAMRDEALG